MGPPAPSGKLSTVLLSNKRHPPQYAKRYLDGYCFRFNRRFSLAAMTECITNTVAACLAAKGMSGSASFMGNQVNLLIRRSAASQKAKFMFLHLKESMSRTS